MPSENLWAVWPDGFMCEFASRDMEEALGYRSDDYELVKPTKYSEEDGVPVSWVRI